MEKRGVNSITFALIIEESWMKIVFNKKSALILIIGFLYFAVGDVSRFLGLFGLSREIAYGLFFLLFLLFAVQRITKIKPYDALIIVVILTISLMGTLQYGQYISSLTSKLAPLLIFFPSYIFFRLYDFKKLEDMFEKAAIFSGIFLLVYYVLVVRSSGATYSMSYAYWISFPIVCFTGLFLRKRKIVYLILGILMLITLLIAGSRGALLLTVICIFYLIISEIFKQGTSTRKIIIITGLGLFIFAILYFSDNILAYLSQYSNTSRNIRMLLNGGMLESASRDRIHELCKQLVGQNTWGYGPLASRQLLLGHNYPHSLWYELQLDYGSISGVMLFVIIMFMAIMNLVRYRNKKESILVSFISIIGIGSLMVSSSYLYEMYVPATVAMYINWNLNYKHSKVNGDKVG